MGNKIEIIGLGAGDINQLQLGIYKKLISKETPIMARTMDHPVIEALKNEGVAITSFDQTYEKAEQFADVYHNIVQGLLEKAKKTSLIYAVPGHPMLAEKTVQLLLEQTEVVVEVAGGQSYLDDLFTALGIDPIDGFQFADGTGFERMQLNYRNHIIFCQVYDQFIASDIKLSLLEDLPADYPITIIEAAGSNQENKKTIPLEELDRSMEITNLTSVYIPPAPADMLHHTFSKLREVIAILRSPNGCPWDLKQTHETLKEYAIEEVYELMEAIDEQDDNGVIEELGDILLQVMLHSQIGEDNGYFTVDDVVRSITDKMIHRHPHVFADKQDDEYKTWEALKQEEKGEQRKSLLDGVPIGLPALAKAYKLQGKASKVGFGWDNTDDIWEKLWEELEEVNQAIKSGNEQEMANEMGDVLFVLANLSRYYRINPEISLNHTNQKFTSRFTYMEERLEAQEKDIYQTSLKEMDYYWNQAKGRE